MASREKSIEDKVKAQQSWKPHSEAWIQTKSFTMRGWGKGVA
jgi:hypothetical protein